MKNTQTNWIACFHRLVICWDEICPLSLFYIEQLLSHEMWASPFISAKDRRSKRFLYLLSELAGTVTKKNQSGKLSDSCSQGNCIYAKNKVESQCRKVIKGYKRSSLSKWWKNSMLSLCVQCDLKQTLRYLFPEESRLYPPGTRFTSQRNHIVIQNTIIHYQHWGRLAEPKLHYTEQKWHLKIFSGKLLNDIVVLT